MDRPQELHLLPDETFPCERTTNENVAALKNRTKIVHNMTEMADFVFKMYMQKVEAIKETMVSRDIESRRAALAKVNMDLWFLGVHEGSVRQSS